MTDSVTLRACTDCAMVVANDEWPERDDERQRLRDAFDRLAREGWTVAYGSDEHADGCADTYPDGGCDCEQYGFTWNPCECCLSTLGGDRVALTLFGTD